MTHRVGLTLVVLSFGALAQPAWCIPTTITQEAELTGGYLARTGGGLPTHDSETLIDVSFAQFDAALGQLQSVDVMFSGHLGDPPGVGGSSLQFTISPAQQVNLGVQFVMRSSFGAVTVEESAGAYTRSTVGFPCQPQFPDTNCRGSLVLPEVDALMSESFGAADVAQLLAFTGNGLFDVSVGTHEFLSCNGCSSAQASAYLSGVLSVAYTYETTPTDPGPGPVTVSEPAISMLTALGLVLLVHVRRRRIRIR